MNKTKVICADLLDFDCDLLFRIQDQFLGIPMSPIARERSRRETHKKYEGQINNAEDQYVLPVLNQIRQNLKQSSQDEIRQLQVYTF